MNDEDYYDENIYDIYDPANDRVEDGFFYYALYRCIFPFRGTSCSSNHKTCLHFIYIGLWTIMITTGLTIGIFFLIKYKFIDY